MAKYKKTKKTISTREKKHSPFFAKFALLFFVAGALIFGILIMSSSKKFLQEKFSETFQKEPSPMEEEIRLMVKDYPIEKMAPYIAQKDRKTAAFMIGIAKKESDWGKRVPILDGRDCYNYWGYRGQGKLTQDGYSCFKNPRQAVNIISRRINELVEDSNLNTPEKMKVWKCGWSCEEHSPESVEKWISDVDYYFQKFY